MKKEKRRKSIQSGIITVYTAVHDVISGKCPIKWQGYSICNNLF